MNRKKEYIVTRQWVEGEPIKTELLTFNQAIKACLHFERMGYQIVKMEKIGGFNVA